MPIIWGLPNLISTSFSGCGLHMGWQYSQRDVGSRCLESQRDEMSWYLVYSQPSPLNSSVTRWLDCLWTRFHALWTASNVKQTPASLAPSLILMADHIRLRSSIFVSALVTCGDWGPLHATSKSSIFLATFNAFTRRLLGVPAATLLGERRPTSFSCHLIL